VLHVHCSLTTPGCPGTSAEKQSVHPPAVVKFPRQPAGQARTAPPWPGAVQYGLPEQSNSPPPAYWTTCEGQQDEKHVVVSGKLEGLAVPQVQTTFWMPSKTVEAAQSRQCRPIDQAVSVGKGVGLRLGEVVGAVGARDGATDGRLLGVVVGALVGAAVTAMGSFSKTRRTALLPVSAM
jgi:hypothetical protein